MRKRAFPITIALFIALSLIVRQSYSEQTVRLVARVNGEEIPYSVIRATPERIDSAFEERHDRAPADQDHGQLKSLRLEIEAARLERVLRQKVRDAELTRLGVLPTGAEIEARCDRDYPPDVRRARGEEFRNVTRVILRAYERILVDGDAPEDVYEELL